MKAKIRETGEIVEVFCNEQNGDIFDKKHLPFDQYHKNELDFNYNRSAEDQSEYYSDERRFLAAKDFMAAMIIASKPGFSIRVLACNAVKYADELLCRLSETK